MSVRGVIKFAGWSGRIGCAVRARSHHSESLAKHKPIGFVGLGNMGSRMAAKLNSCGYNIIAHDMDRASVDSIVSPSIRAASSLKVVAEVADCIITMLPASQPCVDNSYPGYFGLVSLMCQTNVLVIKSVCLAICDKSEHVKAVYTGDDGLLAHVQQGTLFIDSSTIEPAVSQEVAKLAEEKGADFFDAPVSGGIVAARDGKLTFMVGGKGEHLPEVEKLLSFMGKSVVHCGPNGTGQAAKICNNMLLGISMIGTSEAMNLGEKLGLDPKLLARILNSSSGRCWSSELYNPCPGVVDGVPSSNDYNGGFGAALMAKDLNLAQRAAMDLKAATPLGEHALLMYNDLCSKGLDKKDFSVMYKYLQGL